LVKSHILPDYYTLQTLQSAVSIFKLQTLATLDKGPWKFLLNISTLTSSVLELDTTIVRANITRTIYDHENVIIYAVSNVLFPPELFRPPPPPVSSAVFPLPIYFYSFLVCLFLGFYY
jgi:uncharacterized surface protein with fasciclin (FAS1) repeats